MVCAWCRQGQWLRLRHWFMGGRSFWWCSFCVELTMPVDDPEVDARIDSPQQQPEGSTRVSDRVAWQWLDFGLGRRVYLWHWCEHPLWAGREQYDQHPEGFRFWVPTGTAAHQVVSTDPLHLEPSVYWPDCCGLHGFIRGGEWIDA